MSYPDILLKRPFRRLIMAFFILVFLAVAPGVVLYSAGYRYDVGNRQFKQTGVMSIDVSPDTARVVLNDIVIKKNLPITLNNTAPGRYRVRIEQNGYLPWGTEVEVESKQTTFIKDVTLYTDELPVTVFNESRPTPTQVHMSHKGEYLAFVSRDEEDKKTLVEIYDTENGTIETVWSSATKSDVRAEWSPHKNILLIARHTPSGFSITLIEADDTDRQNTYTLLTQKDHPWQWGLRNGDERLFAESSATVFEYTPKNRIRKGTVSRSVPWFVDEDDHLWTVDAKQKALVRSDRDESIALSDPNAIARIIHIDTNKVLIQGEGDMTIVMREQQTKSRVSASTARFNATTNEWNLWSPWELWTVYPDGNIETLYRTSDAMRDIQPLEQSGTLLIVTDKQVLSFNPGYFVTQSILDGQVVTAVVDTNQRQLYFAGTVGESENLYRRGF